MNRYKNQISLDAIGEIGQNKLGRSSVLVIGVGGLGCPALGHLVGAGIGTIGLADGDVVSKENLHRQLLYDEQDIGLLKVDVAAQKLQKKNSDVRIVTHPYYINQLNAQEIIMNYDLILDCTDRVSARYLINDTCISLNKTWIFGAIHQYEGQLAVFNYKNSGTYRCLFPESTAVYEAANCQQIGVLPTLPGLVGIMQANEALKILLSIPEILSNKLLLVDVRNWHLRQLSFEKKNDPKVMFELKHKTLILAADLNKKHQLLDIRHFDEFEKNAAPYLFKIDPVNVKKYILNNDNNCTYVLVCEKGNRSLVLANKLNAEGIENIMSLAGGISVVTSWYDGQVNKDLNWFESKEYSRTK